MSYTRPLPQTAETEVPLKDLFAIVRRQKWITLGILAMCLGLAALVSMLMEPVWQSTSRVLLDGKTQGFPQGNIDILNTILPPQIADDIPTQMELMQSDRIIIDTLNALNLPLPAPDPNVAPDPMITVRQAGFTGIVEVSVQSRNQNNAKAIADKLPEIFNQYMRQRSVDSVDRAVAYLDQQIEEKKTQVGKSEEALNAFKLERKLVGNEIEQSDRIAQRSFASRDAAQSAAELESAKNYLQQLLNVRQGIPDYLESDNKQTNNDERLAVQNQIRAARADLDGLLAQYTDQHPLVLQQKDRIASLEKSLKALPAEISTHQKVRNPQAQVFDEKIGDAKARLEAANAAYTSKQAAMDNASQDLKVLTEANKQLGALSRDLLQRVTDLGQLTRVREEFALRRSASKSYMQLVGPATPSRQIKPNPPLYLTLAALIGILLSIPVASMKDRKDDKVINIDQATRIAGALGVGHIPVLHGAQSGAGLVRLDPSVPRFENFRILRSNILFNAAETGLRTMLITSTSGGEGKSDVAYNLAVAMAVDNRKVLLVDANFRRPALHKKLRFDERPGLTEVLAGEETLAAVTRATEHDNLSVIVAGGAVASPAELIHSKEMADFIATVKGEYDLVIFDGAPALPNSDAQILSSLVDGVLFVVQLNQTRAGSMEYAINLLRQAHATILGVVFNKMEGTADGSAFRKV